MEESTNFLPAVGQGINKKSLLVRSVGALTVISGVGLAWPLILNAFLGITTFYALGISFLVAALGSKFIPLLFDKVDNLVLGLRKEEAEKNPILQLQRNSIDGQAELTLRKENLEEQLANIDSLKSELDGARKDFPDDNWAAAEEEIRIAEAEYEIEEQEVAELEASLEATNKQIKYWERNLKLIEKAEKLKKSKNPREAAIQQILNDTATQAVLDRIGKARAAGRVKQGLRDRKEALKASSNNQGGK